MADIQSRSVYLQGLRLGERLDADALVKIAQKDGKVRWRKSHEFLCNADGVAMIKNDIANEGVTHIMIGAVAPRQDRGVLLPGKRVCACQPA